MASRFQNLRPGVLVLALAISVFIWAVAQGTSSVLQSFDVKVELVGVEEPELGVARRARGEAELDREAELAVDRAAYVFAGLHAERQAAEVERLAGFARRTGAATVVTAEKSTTSSSSRPS